MFSEYPRVAIIGDTGDGKTLVMTALAIEYALAGKKVFSNYAIYGIDYEYLDPKDIAEKMFDENSDLHDCVICTDEAHMDLGKFSYHLRQVRDIGDFATQTRKRRIIWLYTTQVFDNLVKTVRDLTTNIIYCKPLGDDWFSMQIHNRLFANRGYIKTIQLYGVPYYDLYNTEEIITKSIEIKEK